jgi:two-component sensor histidine kinase
MIPFLKIVTGTTTYFPAIDLAMLVRRICTGHWRASGGSGEKLYLVLKPLPVSLDRAAFLTEAVKILMHTSLSPGFTPAHGRLGVHLWPLDRNRRNAILLIADDQMHFLQEPVTDDVAHARRLVEQAGCHLVRHAAPGTVWRIDIPAR